MSKVLFVLYTCSILLYNLTGIDYLFYLAFLYAFYICIKKYGKTNNEYYLIELIIYSIIIPNNYIVLISLIVILTIRLRSTIKFSKLINTFLTLIFIAYLILNTFINRVSTINFLCYIAYVAPIPICAVIFGQFKYEFTENEKLISLLKQILIIQGIGVISELIFNINTILSMIDFDWVTGTFGEFQGNIFFFFCAFCFIVFLNRYMIYRKDLKYLIASGILMIMTGSIALIVLFAISVTIYFFMSLNIKPKTRIKIVALLGIASIFFILVTPAWIKNYMVKMVTAEDKSIYISKIDDFENVFLNPNNPLEFELFGAGIGEYSSRAALTCTGIYVDSYNSLFKPSMSEYTRKYIYNKLLWVYEYKLGIVDTPFSQYISVKGELGVVGIVFLILYFLNILKKNKKWSRIYIIFIILACFTENYMEFAKITSLLYIINYIYQGNDMEFKKESSNSIIDEKVY